MAWNRRFIELGEKERCAPDQQTRHDGQIRRRPMRHRLSGVNPVQGWGRPAAAVRRRHARRAAAAAHLLATSAFGRCHLRSGKRAGHGRRKKRH